MNIIEEVKEGLPSNAMVSDICFEGSEIVIYTKNREFFLDNGTSIRELVKKLKKRIEVRPDPSINMDMEKVMKKIKEIVPEEAKITDISFEPGFSRVIIESEKPGLVIGKGGTTLQEIKKKTFWAPMVKRAPVIKSDVVQTVRKVLLKESEFRKQFLNKVGERIHTTEPKEIEWIRVTALGGFGEVGRSCVLLQTPQSSILLDCGVKPGDNGFPYLQTPEFDIKRLDAVIVSHTHLDHCGFVPYLYEYGYEGPVYCTPPTRDLMVLLCLDYLDVAQREGGIVPYSSKSIENAVKHCVTLEYDEVSDITPDMRLTFQNAGHILGSALVHIHIGEGVHNLVYTGDYNFDKSRLFEPADINFQRVETLITESTYGGLNDVQPPRKEAEDKLISLIKETVSKGGKVLIPSFAVGRAQEIMCILAKEKDFQYPVYLEGMLWDATAIHTTYPEYLTKELQHQIFHKGDNPFLNPMFKRVGSVEERKELMMSKEPCVVVATSGMMTGGPVMEYLKEFAEDPKNTLIFVGYQAEGTMGRRIQKGWEQIPVTVNANGTNKKISLEIKIRIETVNGLSGHSDKNQILNFIYKLKSKPNMVICNHGDDTKTVELAKNVHKLFKIKTKAPKNLETVRLK